MMQMNLHISSGRGQKTNTSYPFSTSITSLDELKEAVQYDHVCAKYADGKNNRGNTVKAYRSKKTFLSSDCLAMDCDNTNANPLENDVPEDNWKTPADVAAAFPDVPFYVVYSRNHMKEKDGKSARPRFHVYFPMGEVKSVDIYEKLKSEVYKRFPSFDDNAIDAARFFFGVENPEVEYFGGNTRIDDFIFRANTLPEIIPSGSRNATLLSYGSKYLKRFGESEKAYQLFLDTAERCDEPLNDEELKQIWSNALNFYHSTVETDPSYLTPDEFDGSDFETLGAAGSGIVTSDDIRKALQKMNIHVRLNVITGQVEIEGMPDKYSRTNAPNTLPTLLQDYFSYRGIHCSRQVIDDSLVLIEDENRFNPVEDMLKATVHDGKDRITKLSQILGIDHNPDFVLYLTKWLHQCVAMALNDDSEPYGADGVLVIQAPQGCGKTFFCRKIAMKSDWFAEGLTLDLDNKDSIIQATGKWISELGELDSTLKREQSALKAFLTSSKDIYRLPYAKVSVNKPRRTSFCATVNPKEFLNDDTGSRRYWVVQPTRIDVPALINLDDTWLRQLWSQVYHTLYLEDPQGFRLTEDERKKLQKENEQYSKPLPGEIEIMEKLFWDAPVDQWKWRKISDVTDDLCLKNVSASQMGRVLTKLMTRDNRIQTKSPHNVKHYLLPPRWVREFDTIEYEESGAFQDDFLKAV